MTDAQPQGNNIKKNIAYGTVGAAFYYAFQWLVLIIVVKIAGYAVAGLYSLATSVTAAPTVVAAYSMRNFQVSDVKEEYRDRDYFDSRIASSILSLIICLVMIFVGGYSLGKSLIILAYMGFKIVEGFADFFYALEQKEDRLDYSGISMIMRGVGYFVCFVAGYKITNDLFLTLLICTAFSLAVIVLFDRTILKRIRKRVRGSFDGKKVFRLLVVCAPLAFVAFMNNLAVMLPRLFLEKYFGEEIMGYYSSVSSPTLVIQMFATNFFAPYVLILTDRFERGEKKAFLKIIYKFFTIAAGLTVVAVAAAFLLGDWVLVLIFGKEIHDYTFLLIPVILMTVLMAANSCLLGICTLMRILKEQYLRGIVGVTVSFVSSLLLVKRFELMGVVYATGIAILAQMIMQIYDISRKVREMK